MFTAEAKFILLCIGVTTQAPASLGGISRPCHPKSLLAPLRERVNFCTSTRGPANFCPKIGQHKRFYMKQQDRSRKRDQ